MAAKKKETKTTSSLARGDDGGIQITFSIPFEKIKKVREEAAVKLGRDLEIPGFRKGKAPLAKLLAEIPSETLLERTLQVILPGMLAEEIKKNNLKLAIYPRFELLKAKEGEDFQIRAVSAEIPSLDLGNYKEALKGAGRAKAIWTPGDKDKEETKEPTRAQKEQLAIETLLTSVKVRLPSLLVEEEVNSRLAQLLERLEKLGLDLDRYLASAGKSASQLRADYQKQAEAAITLDLVLGKIAQEEKIVVKKEEVDKTIKAASADPELGKRLDTPNQRRLIESVLIKRAVLDSLIALM